MPNVATDTLQEIFPGSVLHLSDTPGPGFAAQEMASWPDSIFLTVLIILSAIALILSVSSALEVIPSFIGCILRSKESENLNNSVPLSICRNRVCICFMIPLMLIIERYGLYPPACRFSEVGAFFVIFGVFMAYICVRLLCQLIFRGHKIGNREWQCGIKISHTFFAITGILVCITLGLCKLIGATDEVIAGIIKWEVIGIYCVSVIRKTQFFCNSRGLFAGFLYLCTLELIPTFLLVGSAIYF